MRVGGVPTGDALNRRFKMVEAAFLNECDQFRAEPAGTWCFMNDETPAGLFHRLFNRLEVKRDKRPKIDDLGVDPFLFDRGKGDMDHRSVGENREFTAFANDGRLADWDAIMSFGNFACRVLRPGFDRPVVVSVEGPIIDSLWLEKDDWVRVFNRGDEEALCVARSRRNDNFQAGNMGEEGFGRLAVSLAAEDAAAVGSSDYERHRPFTRRSVAHLCNFADN